MNLYKLGSRIERYPFPNSKIIAINGRFKLKDIKELLGISKYDNIPVKIVDDDVVPRIEGNSWCYKTISGKKISFPSAYRKVAWSNMLYCHSTRRLIVSKNLLK